MQTRRSFFVPQVIQTSAMDCGPAALKSLLDGFGGKLNYARLREACQTDVDGTSIDTLEDIAVQLGFDAAQLLIPKEHLFLNSISTLPSLILVRLPDGAPHVIVLWQIIFDWAQIMDPATGRRWLRLDELKAMLYTHHQLITPEAWLQWGGSSEFLDPLRQRLRRICEDSAWVEGCIEMAAASEHWSALATLDAAVRMVEDLLKTHTIASGNEAGKLVNQLYKHPSSIAGCYWLVYPAPQDSSQLIFRSAVIVHIPGRLEQQHASETSENLQEDTHSKPLPEDIANALKEKQESVLHRVFSSMRADGLLTPTLLVACAFFAAIGITVEVIVLRGLVEIAEKVHLLPQQEEGYALVFIFFLSLLLLEWPMTMATWQIGRRLEIRLRQQLLEKLPQLEDGYFHSRLTSDMIQRAFELRDLRNLPDLAINFWRLLLQIVFICVGLIVLYPAGTGLIVLSATLIITLTFATQPLLREQDMQFRTHMGGLSRFYLDALLGLTPIQAHRAEAALRTKHDQRLLQWMKSGQSFFASFELSTLIQLLGSTLLSMILVSGYFHSGVRDSSGMLLLLYWILQLPVLGTMLAETAQQYPARRNRLLRVLEPLSAPNESHHWYTDDISPPPSVQASAANSDITNGVTIVFHQVELKLRGHTVLHDLQAIIRAGEHLAVVGKSGAGKSTLVGLLLGWHKPSSGGSVWVDGELLHGDALHRLRRELVWVDPEIQLWNKSLLQNIRYGNETEDNDAVDDALWEQAELLPLLDQLPEREQSLLGEQGGLLSGGEGQRVRLARAMNRKKVRLVILDEPFRGLTREQRSRLLLKARQYWRHATLIFISHDVGDTHGFDRVWVIDEGRLVEDDAPATLTAQPSSHYARLLKSERKVQELIRNDTNWRNIRLHNGKIEER